MSSGQPFSIKIVNASGQPAVSNVDIGDSYANRNLSNFGQDSNITITSNVGGITYTEWLAQSESRPFNIGKTEIISTTAGQVEQTIALTHRNASGDLDQHVISPMIDAYQYQTDRIVDDFEYLFDGFSRFRISSVGINATVIIKMWPKAIFSGTQIVAGRKGVQNFKMRGLF